MGYKHDQNPFPETYRPDPSSDRQSPSRERPALPPRVKSASLSPSLQPPPTYAEAVPTYHSQPLTGSWSSQDPRSSSTRSLVPVESRDGRRTLLLIYIHGFLGTEETFRSFPAHVHNLVTVLLADTHVVHTKIYPRYKSKKPIEYARDEFSNWICPHESANTDVMLMGHSMGGILATEVALLPPYSRGNAEKFRHRILGTINFDTPFLGMHPGVVVSGIGSLFRPAPRFSDSQLSNVTTGESELSPMPAGSEISPNPSFQPTSADLASVQTPNNSTLANPNADLTRVTSARSSPADTPQVLLSPVVSCKDPNFNPQFANDMPTPVRKGWDGALHFITKHSDGLHHAAKSYMTSHLEFGGCLADYKGLKNRYSRVKALDSADPHQGNHATRIRFVNYYTASTGRPKRTKPLPPSDRTAQLSNRVDPEEPIERELQDMSLSFHGSLSLPRSPRTSVEELQDSETLLKSSQDSDEHTSVVNSRSSVMDTTTSDVALEMDLLDAVPTMDDASDDNTMRIDVSNSSLTSGIMSFTASTVSAPSNSDKLGGEAQVKAETDLLLPPLPPSPKQPPVFSPSSYADKDARNLARKEFSRQNKAYMQALKDHEKCIRDREKLVEKRAKAARKVSEKETKLNEKENLKAKKEEAKLKSRPAPSDMNSAMVGGGRDSLESSSDKRRLTGSEATKRDKKFCMLPPKINNQVDPCWVRVFMRDMDEVEAHCGLFFVGEQYEWLVSDVGNRIKEWVQER